MSQIVDRMYPIQFALDSISNPQGKMRLAIADKHAPYADEQGTHMQEVEKNRSRAGTIGILGRDRNRLLEEGQTKVPSCHTLEYRGQRYIYLQTYTDQTQ